MMKFVALSLLLALAAFAEGRPDSSTLHEGDGAHDHMLARLLTQIMQDMTEMKEDITELKTEDSKLASDIKDLKDDYKELSDTGNNNMIWINGKLTDIENTVDATYAELKSDVLQICVNLNSIGSGSYRYEVSPTPTYTWKTGRQFCKSKGGDLAFNGFDSINYREKVLCDTLNFCDSGSNRVWWGLSKVDDSNKKWEYVDGTTADDDDIHWSDESEPTDSGEDQCGRMWSDHDDDRHLLAASRPCSQLNYALCEFEC